MSKNGCAILTESPFLEALQGRNRGRPPIWLMRQAGRYLPSYRALREKYSFLELCHQPELIAEVTQLPIHQLGFDAAILFADILLILEAFGVKVRFDEGIGPIIDPPIRTEQDIQRLISQPAPQVLSYVAEGIRLLKPQLKVPLIGFCGAPFTVASYLIEGKTSRDLKTTKQMMYTHPGAFHHLLDKLTAASLDYLKMQVEAGVDAIQIFDSWAHVLSPASFREVCFPYLKRLVDGLRLTGVPVILFCKGTGGFFKQLVEIEPQGISVDWGYSLLDVRRGVSGRIALQGNLDPYVLYAPLPTIRRETFRILESMKGDSAYIFNLGHGILPDVSVEAVRTLVDCVKG